VKNLIHKHALDWMEPGESVVLRIDAAELQRLRRQLSTHNRRAETIYATNILPEGVRVTMRQHVSLSDCPSWGLGQGRPLPTDDPVIIHRLLDKVNKNAAALGRLYRFRQVGNRVMKMAFAMRARTHADRAYRETVQRVRALPVGGEVVFHGLQKSELRRVKANIRHRVRIEIEQYSDGRLRVFRTR
jgi:hypothetical protein